VATERSGTFPCDSHLRGNDRTSSHSLAPPSALPLSAFLASLTERETAALGLALGEGDLKGFARKQQIMLEVLVDRINEKAFDCIGDAIMELDGEDAFIFEDYRDDLKKAVNT
jgi:hypothetical protein